MKYDESVIVGANGYPLAPGASRLMESWEDFAASVSDEPRPMLVPGLIPGDDGITCFHGAPRTLKSWAMEEAAVALATGSPAFGSLPVAGPVAVAYLSNEDSRAHVKRRVAGLLAGRPGADLGGRLMLAVHTVDSLDNERTRAELRAELKRAAVRVVFVDPLRSVTTGVDQGPAEIQSFMRFCRQLVSDGIAVVLGHHDVKAGGRDPGQRLSGGGLLSHVDAPIAFERADDDGPAIATPHRWKHSDCPEPMRISITSRDGAMFVTAGAIEARAARRDSARDEQIIAFLEKNPGSSENQIARHVGMRRSIVPDAMLRLGERVVSANGLRGAQLWRLTDATVSLTVSPLTGGDTGSGRVGIVSGNGRKRSETVN